MKTQPKKRLKEKRRRAVFQAVVELRKLIENKETTNYTDFGAIVGCHCRHVARQVLAPILWACELANQPCITSIVHKKGKNRPGEGAYNDEVFGVEIDYNAISDHLLTIMVNNTRTLSDVVAYGKAHPNISRKAFKKYLEKTFS